MDLKKLIKKAAVEQVTNKILPMESPPKKLGTKSKIAAILAAIATVAGVLSQYLGG
jgi:hypothetical protein